jgi:hypothetical protein
VPARSIVAIGRYNLKRLMFFRPCVTNRILCERDSARSIRRRRWIRHMKPFKFCLPTSSRGQQSSDKIVSLGIDFISPGLILLHTRFRYSCKAVFFATLSIWLGIGGHVPAQTPYGNKQEAEAWAWAQIKQGKTVDFNVRCGAALDPRAENESRWTDGCRRLPQTSLQMC